MISPKRVEQGNPLQISAATWNTLTEMARQWRNGSLYSKRPQQFETSSVKAYIKNNSGSDRERFESLKIDGVVFGFNDNAEEFLDRWTLTGVTPNSSGSVAVLQEPVKSGEIALAVISGATPAIVDINNAADNAVYMGSGYELETGSEGYPILWKESGTGTGKHALVFVNTGGGTSGGGGFVIARTFSAFDSLTLEVSAQIVAVFGDVPGTVGQTISLHNSIQTFTGDAADEFCIAMARGPDSTDYEIIVKPCHGNSLNDPSIDPEPAG